MVILITPDGYVVESGDAPTVGRRYYLEDATTGTLAQGKAFHALIQCYWTSGAHSYNVKTFDEFRDCIKRDLGAGFDSYVWADEFGIHKAKTLDEIPTDARADRRRILGKLKSWADYTSRERRESIDRVIAEMHQAGVTSRKFYEILEGMQRGQNAKD